MLGVKLLKLSAGFPAAFVVVLEETVYANFLEFGGTVDVVESLIACSDCVRSDGKG